MLTLAELISWVSYQDALFDSTFLRKELLAQLVPFGVAARPRCIHSVPKVLYTHICLFLVDIKFVRCSANFRVLGLELWVVWVECVVWARKYILQNLIREHRDASWLQADTSVLGRLFLDLIHSKLRFFEFFLRRWCHFHIDGHSCLRCCDLRISCINRLGWLFWLRIRFYYFYIVRFKLIIKLRVFLFW